MLELVLESESLDIENGSCVSGFFIAWIGGVRRGFQARIETCFDTKTDVYARPKQSRDV